MRGKPRSKQKTGPSLSLLTFPFFTITTVLLFTLKHEVTLMIPIRYDLNLGTVQVFLHFSFNKWSISEGILTPTPPTTQDRA